MQHQQHLVAAHLGFDQVGAAGFEDRSVKAVEHADHLLRRVRLAPRSKAAYIDEADGPLNPTRGVGAAVAQHVFDHLTAKAPA